MSAATKSESPPHSAPGRGGALKSLVIAAVVIAGAAALGWWYVEHRRESPSAGGNHGGDDSAGGAVAPIAVETIHPSPGGIERVSTQIGTVRPYEEADLYAKVSGYLSKLHVDYGDHVKQDQLLAEIDDPEIVEDAKKSEADVAQAKAAVEQAKAFIESAKADRDASASSVDQAIAEVDRYTSMRSYHEKKYARYRDLVDRKAIPQQIADEEEESYESARASEVASKKAVLNSKAQLVAANARVKKAEADLAEAKANVDVAEAKLGRAKVLVNYMNIRSPYNGVITHRNFFRGAFIRSASEGGTIPLLTVARTDKVRVVTQIPDRDVPFTTVGDPAVITLDALGDEPFKGTVSRFAETEDPTSRTMHTEIDLPNPHDKLRPGMYGIARVILDKAAASTTIPSKALVGESRDGTAEVYLAKDGKAKKEKIKIGADDGLRVEVRSGISEEDDVIVDTGSISDGVPVKITREVKMSPTANPPLPKGPPGEKQ